jgi:hypothetical protein
MLIRRSAVRSKTQCGLGSICDLSVPILQQDDSIVAVRRRRDSRVEVAADLPVRGAGRDQVLGHRAQDAAMQSRLTSRWGGSPCLGLIRATSKGVRTYSAAVGV